MFKPNDGSMINPVNLRVMLESEPIPSDPLLARTIPAEYAAELPEVNSAYDVDANQGVRDGTVVAIKGSQFLVEYEMPAGRTYGRVFDVLRPDWFRSVPMNNLPAGSTPYSTRIQTAPPSACWTLLAVRSYLCLFVGAS